MQQMVTIVPPFIINCFFALHDADECCVVARRDMCISAYQCWELRFKLPDK